MYGGKEIAQLKKSRRNATGEFAVVCRAGSIDKHLNSDQKQPKNREQTKHVKQTAVETASHNSTSSDDEFFSQAVKHLKQVRKIKSGYQAKPVTMQIDEINVMDEHQLNALPLTQSMTKLNTLQSKLPVRGDQVHSHHKKQDLWHYGKICDSQGKNPFPSPH